MNYVFTGTVEYDACDRSKTVPGRFTIKGDCIILWTYDYYGNKTLRKVMRRQGEDRKIYYEKRKDTSGQYFEVWSEWTKDYCYYRNTQGMNIGSITIQTWNRKEIWIKIHFELKKEMACEYVTIILDDKSQRLFEQYINSLKGQ